MRANWIKGRKKLFANVLCFLSRTARHTWKQHWLSEYIAGRSAVGVGRSGATARPASRKESADGVLVISLILTEVEARRVQGWITNKCPDQMQLPFALWTAQAARELIHKKFGKSLGLSTMQLYLKRWGFSAQKPLTRATQRDPQKIAAWLEQDYPSIAARAKRDKAVIYWSDETGICNQDQIGKGYAPKGQTPILTQTGQKFSTSMIAAVSNRGLMRFKLYKGALNVAIFIDFMKRLIKDAKQKVFLIVDNLRVHHAKAVQDWLARHKVEIEIFYLPAYAPEHNPDEYLNNDLKQTIKNKPRAKTRDFAATSSILKSIQRRPDRVKSYFHAKYVRYAA